METNNKTTQEMNTNRDGNSTEGAAAPRGEFEQGVTPNEQQLFSFQNRIPTGTTTVVTYTTTTPIMSTGSVEGNGLSTTRNSEYVATVRVAVKPELKPESKVVKPEDIEVIDKIKKNDQVARKRLNKNKTKRSRTTRKESIVRTTSSETGLLATKAAFKEYEYDELPYDIYSSDERMDYGQPEEGWITPNQKNTVKPTASLTQLNNRGITEVLVNNKFYLLGKIGDTATQDFRHKVNLDNKLYDNVVEVENVNINEKIVDDRQGEIPASNVSYIDNTNTNEKRNKQNELDSNNNKKELEKENKQKKYLPPITIENTKFRVIGENLREQKVDFKARAYGPNKVKVFLTNKEHYDNLILDLERLEVSFYHHTPKDEKPIAILVKGVHHTCTPEEVMEGFREEFPDIKILSASRFETPISKKKTIASGNMYHLNMYKFLIAPGQNIENVIKAKTFMNYIVSWEKPKSLGPVQCHRCQQLGHISINCKRTFVCVKCTKDHGPGRCTLRDEEVPRCANCGLLGHPASYRGCEYHVNYVNKGTQFRSKLNQRNQSNFNYNTQVRDGISFADTLRQPPKFDSNNFPSLMRNQKGDNNNGNYNRLSNNDYNGFNGTGDALSSLLEWPIKLFGITMGRLTEVIQEFNQSVRNLPKIQVQALFLEFTNKLFNYGFK